MGSAALFRTSFHQHQSLKRQLTNPCIILEGVMSTGEYQGFNPENEYIFWREIWLERVSPAVAAADTAAAGSRV